MATDLKSPQQQIYDAVFLASEHLGFRTVDFLPPQDYGVPFVFMGEQFDQDRRNKSILFGDVQQSIHFYHDYRKRRELATMMDKMKVECRKLTHTDNFFVVCKQISGQMTFDQTTPETLLHGLVEVEFTFT